MLGRYNRNHLIAYGLLRGVPYEKIERCAEQNVPNASTVFEIMKTHGSWELLSKWSLETVSVALKRATS